MENRTKSLKSAEQNEISSDIDFEDIVIDKNA